MAKRKKLTKKQEDFCLGIIQGKNSADAYTSAYNVAGMKRTTVTQAACRLLATDIITDRIAELRMAAADDTIMSAREALAEATRLARFDIRRLYKPDGTPIPAHKLDEDTARCIAAVDIQEVFSGSGEDKVLVGYTKKYKVSDKNSALDKLFKHHGLYEKDNQQKVEPITQIIREIVEVTRK